MNNTDTKHYVLYVDPKSERKVEVELSKMGIPAYVPVKRQLSQWKDRKRWVDRVLFNSYVFVEISQQRKNEVFLSNHVKRYVQFDGSPACLSYKDIALIHQLCKLKQEVEITHDKLCEGQLVEIVTGDLIGYRGRIMETRNGKMLRIKILGLGCFAQVALDAFSIRLISST